MTNVRTLKNGVRLATEKLPHIRSAALGLWAASGARHEPAALGGISHFIEHMVFKGTEKRTAAEAAEAMDKIGGQINAFTTKECTCYYGRSLDTHLGDLTDLLSDMFFHAKFSESDVAIERGVIIEEIGMYEDSPEDLSSELFFDTVYKGSALARPILGRPDTLNPMTGAAMKSYMREHYVPEATIISLSGNFSDTDVDALAALFEGMPVGRAPVYEPAKFQPGASTKEKDTEQNHLLLGFEGFPHRAKERYALNILSSVLGGGMSSRLFQKVREERGLCYSVYTFGSPYHDTGAFGIYTATGKETEMEAVSVISEELIKMERDGPKDAEVELAREQTKASILLGMESTVSRMNNMARGLLFQEEILTADEIIERYDAVSTKDVHEIAKRVLNFENIALAAVGRVSGKDAYLGALGGPISTSR